MPPPENLTTSKLVDLLEAERKEFSEDYFPLTNEQLQGVEKYSKLVTINRHAIVRNIPKKRAHAILSDIWKQRSLLLLLLLLIEG
jgi:hypothetical protein